MIPAKALGKDIEHWLQREFMSISDEEFEAAMHAWLSCQIADRPDNSSEICQRLHRQDLQKFHDAIVAR